MTDTRINEYKSLSSKYSKGKRTAREFLDLNTQFSGQVVVSCRFIHCEDADIILKAVPTPPSSSSQLQSLAQSGTLPLAATRPLRARRRSKEYLAVESGDEEEGEDEEEYEDSEEYKQVVREWELATGL